MEDRFRTTKTKDHTDSTENVVADTPSKQSDSKRPPLSIRKVSGCGRNHGFQLVVDSQQMMTLLPKAHLALGFKVFVTLPGVVTSRVPFHVDPGFFGEHNFFLHGIHVIKVRALCACNFNGIISFLTKWNVTPLLLGGINFYFFTDLYCTCIGLNARFALPTLGGRQK